MSEIAPALESADLPEPETFTPSLPPDSPPEPASQDEDTKTKENEEACVVVMEDATPRGRRMADEAREVAAAHASLLVDIEACKRVSMSRRSLLFSFIFLSRFVYCLMEIEWSTCTRFSEPIGFQALVLVTCFVNILTRVMSVCYCPCVVPGSVPFRLRVSDFAAVHGSSCRPLWRPRVRPHAERS